MLSDEEFFQEVADAIGLFDHIAGDGSGMHSVSSFSYYASEGHHEEDRVAALDVSDAQVQVDRDGSVDQFSGAHAATDVYVPAVANGLTAPVTENGLWGVSDSVERVTCCCCHCHIDQAAVNVLAESPHAAIEHSRQRLRYANQGLLGESNEEQWGLKAAEEEIAHWRRKCDDVRSELIALTSSADTAASRPLQRKAGAVSRAAGFGVATIGNNSTTDAKTVLPKTRPSRDCQVLEARMRELMELRHEMETLVKRGSLTRTADGGAMSPHGPERNLKHLLANMQLHSQTRLAEIRDMMPLGSYRCP